MNAWRRLGRALFVSAVGVLAGVVGASPASAAVTSCYWSPEYMYNGSTNLTRAEVFLLGDGASVTVTGDGCTVLAASTQTCATWTTLGGIGGTVSTGSYREIWFNSTVYQLRVSDSSGVSNLRCRPSSYMTRALLESSLGAEVEGGTASQLSTIDAQSNAAQVAAEQTEVYTDSLEDSMAIALGRLTTIIGYTDTLETSIAALSGSGGSGVSDAQFQESIQALYTLAYNFIEFAMLYMVLMMFIRGYHFILSMRRG